MMKAIKLKPLNSILLFTLLGLFSIDLVAQNAVNLTIDKKELQIGEQARLRFELNLPVTEQLRFPELKDTLIKEIEIIQFSAIDTLLPTDDVSRQVLTFDLIITSFDTGFHVIPPLTFYLSSDSLKTDPVLLKVKATTLDENIPLKDIKDPLNVPFSFKEWFLKNWKWIALIHLIILGIALFFIYFRKREKAPSEPIIITPQKAAHEIALEKLHALATKKLWETGKLKAYHSELSETIREYIENRYQVHALEQTTDEIFHHLRYLEITDTEKNKLRQVLMLSDLVKFAKEKPIQSENEQSMSNALEFVTATKEISEEPEPGINKENNNNQAEKG